MRKFTRPAALVLALMLALTFLTACSESAADPDAAAGEAIEIEVDETSGDSQTAEETGESEEDEAEIPDEIPEEALEDVIFYLTDGAYSADTVLASFGDVDVTAAQILYWVAYEQYNQVTYYNYYYSYYYGFTIGMDDVYSDDMTIGDIVLSDGLNDALMYAAVAQKAIDLGVELSADDLAELASVDEDNVTYYGEYLWDSAVESGEISEDDFTDAEREIWINEQGKEFYTQFLVYNSTTSEGLNAIYRDSYYYSALMQYLFEDEGEYVPTEATLSDYIADNGVVWARCILFSTQECEDEDAVAAVKAQADEVYAQLSALSGDALSASFTDMQSDYDVSGYTAGEVQMYSAADADSLVDGYYDGIAQLETGRVGMTDETDYGYFILLREEDQPEDIRSDYINSTYIALIEQWLDESGVTCSMDQMDVQGYFSKLEELQAIIDNLQAAYY